MKIKGTIIFGILIFLVVVSCFSTFAYADIKEKNNVIIKPNDIESDALFTTIKNKETQFNISSNLPVHIYIMTSDAYFDALWYPYDENDFSVNVYERKKVQVTSFKWTQPDDQSYFIVIFNPNNQNATVSYSYTDTVSEEFNKTLTEIGEVCGGTLCVIIVVFDLIISILIAIWINKDAKERGKNSTTWAIIGFVFSILGLIIWILVRPSKKDIVISKPADRICPNCGRVIPIDAIICPYCSKDFRPPKI
ncbi:MAG: zinc ribbon domain-containing protein [Candidatus Thermoplasmatota archaeon]|nr:zinc ribbon domain-containing protein [Candidatus Thermoplasmatota archaeon]